MLNTAYTVDPFLTESIRGIDADCRTILLTPVPPPAFRSLIWQQWMKRLQALSDAGGLALSPAVLQNIWTDLRSYPIGDPRLLISNYRSEVFRITEEWTANPKRVVITDMETVFEHLAFKISRRLPPFPVRTDTARQLLTYVQSREEHPLITAAVVAGQFVRDDQQALTVAFAALAGYVFLYKAGYTARGLIPFDLAILRKSRELIRAREEMAASGNLNPWLAAVINSVRRETGSLAEMLKGSVQIPGIADNNLALHPRQQKILALAAAPGVILTNKLVRKKFRISQITASRDLSKLASLGELFAHGKGRSVYYTKI